MSPYCHSDLAQAREESRRFCNHNKIFRLLYLFFQHYVIIKLIYLFRFVLKVAQNNNKITSKCKKFLNLLYYFKTLFSHHLLPLHIHPQQDPHPFFPLPEKY